MGKQEKHSVSAMPASPYPCIFPGCIFCNRNAVEYIRHLSDRHNLPPHAYVIFPTFHGDRKIRSILATPIIRCPHKDNGCPLETPDTPPGVWKDHLRTTHKTPTTRFANEIARGQHFWWWSEDGIQDPISVAFSSDETRRLVVRHFQAPVDHILSHLDPSDPVHRSRDSLSDGENDSEDETLDQTSFQEAQTEVPLLVPDLPELSVPIVLSSYAHGLLRLVDFPSKPQHLVCLKCRRVQTTRNPLRISKHAASCDGIQSSEEEALAWTGNELYEEQERRSQSQRRPQTQIKCLGSIEEELDVGDEELVTLDDGDEDYDDFPQVYSENIEADQSVTQHDSGNLLRRRFKDLSAFIRELPLSQDLTAFPERPIPFIPFFPRSGGIGCPISNCPVACSCRENIMHHFSGAHKGENYLSEPSPCQMQTLGFRGQYTGYFKVLENQNGDKYSDRIRLDEAMDIEYAEVQAQFKQVEGLSTAESRNALLRKFSWDREFPVGHENRVQFLKNRLCETSLLYKPRAQTTQQHLLHVYVYAYLGHTRRILVTTQERYRLHFGNKLPYNLLHTNAIKTPFRPLERLESLNTYADTLAHFSAYILRAVLDQTEPDTLLLPTQIVEAAQALSRVLCRQAEMRNVSWALHSIHRLPRNDSLLYKNGVLGVEKIDDTLQSHIDEGRDVLHAFLWNLVLHPSGQGPETPNLSLPVSRFIALSSYDAMTKTFRRAGRMTIMMAHLQWGFRSVAFFEFHRQCIELPIPRTADAVDKVLRDIHDMVLIADSTTPFGALQGQLVYAEALQAGAMEVATTMWSSATQTAHYNGMPLPFAKLKDLVHVTLRRAELILFERLAFGTVKSETIQRPAVVYDNVRDSRSYLDSRVNPGFYRHFSLHDTILKEPSLRSRFLFDFAAGGMHIWNGDEVYKYLTLIKDFLYDLATLVYLLSGQVPRGPELLSLRWQSSPFAFRSLFALQGHLMIYQEYAKQDGITGKATRILRMPPQPVSSLIEVYLTYVRPLEHFLWKKFLVGLSEPKVGAESLLFAPFGQPIPAQALSNHLRRLTSIAMGPKARGIGFRGIRQVTTLFANYLLPQEIKTAPLIPSALAAQSGHSERTAQAHYDNHVDFVLGEINTARCEAFRLLSLHWHRLFGFEHPDVTIALSEVSVKADALVRADLHEMSSSIAQRVAPMLSSQVSQTVEEIMITLRATEYTQHHNPPATIRPFLPVRASTVQLLRKLLGDEGVHWRSQEQALAVEHAIRGDPTHLIAVMPTGLGKSLLYQIPALYEENSPNPKYTVLLVPLRSLLHSSIVSCGRLGLAIHAVDSGMAWRDPTERLIVATYDSLAHNSRLQSWLLAYGSQRRIGRIIVDEAHSILSDNQFRSGFTLIMSILLRCTAPLVFTTGTLPIPVQDKLLREIKGASHVCLIRVPTDRPNIVYKVLPKPLDMNSFCAHVQHAIFPTLVQNPKQRVIIFCRYIADCESLSEKLGAFLYHGKANAASKDVALATWLQRGPLETPGKCIMVATSALSMGIDHPHVYHVLFYREPFTLIDYIQQAGRAGRDNRHPAIVEVNPSQSLRDVEPEILEFIETLGCRRNVLQKHMDGIPSSCYGIPNAELCDRCHSPEKDSPRRPLGTSLEHSLTANLPLAIDNRQREQQTLVVEAIYDTIHYLQRHCVKCTLSYINASSVSCDCLPIAKEDIELLDRVIKRARHERPVPGLHTCIYCRMPQMKGIRGCMDRHMTAFGVNGDRACNGQDFILSTFYVALALQRLPPLIVQELGLHPERLGEILWRPVIEPPFDRFDIGRQLLYLHLILPGTISHVNDRPESVSALTTEKWFHSWIPDVRPSTDDKIQYSMSAVLVPPTQIEVIGNAKGGPAPISQRIRPSLRLPAINFVKSRDQDGSPLIHTG